MASYYSTDIRSNKWYMSIVVHFLEIAMHKLKNKKMSSIEYRKLVVESLIREVREKKHANQKEIVERRTSAILTEPQGQECELNFNRKAKCKICAKKNLSKTTSYWCKVHKFEVCILGCYDFHRVNLH